MIFVNVYGLIRLTNSLRANYLNCAETVVVLTRPRVT